MEDALFEEVKSFINFTWEDPAKEDRIRNFIASSKQDLEEVAGVALDWTNDQLARDLLFNRVLYMDSHALDDFRKNYSDMLQELKIKHYPYADEDTR